MSPLLIGLVALASAQMPPHTRLERARVCYEAVDFACAEAELAAARADSGSLTTAQAQTVDRMSAMTALALGKTDEARTHLKALLARQPDFVPAKGAWPAPWRELLEELRGIAPDRLAPTLSVRTPLEITLGQPFEVEVDAEDPSGIGGVTLHLGDGGQPLALATTNGRRWTVRVPGSRVVGSRLELWVVAVDQRGNSASAGSAGAPRIIHVAAPRPEPASVVDTWWFWTAIGGAVLVATATGVTVWLLTKDDPGSGPAVGPQEETGQVRARMPDWFSQ